MNQNKDSGACLSMHQPWASLLVYGIKRIEGRSWPTDHRGVLWIHAAAKQPEPELIASLEAQYKTIRSRPFPKFYPCSVLLGCVEIVDCLSHDELLKKQSESIPTTDDLNKPVFDEENDSEFAIICINPKRLAIPLAISGQHKIWTLPKALHKSAVGGLIPVT